MDFTAELIVRLVEASAAILGSIVILATSVNVFTKKKIVSKDLEKLIDRLAVLPKGLALKNGGRPHG